MGFGDKCDKKWGRVNRFRSSLPSATCDATVIQCSAAWNCTVTRLNRPPCANRHERGGRRENRHCATASVLVRRYIRSITCTPRKVHWLLLLSAALRNAFFFNICIKMYSWIINDNFAYAFAKLYKIIHEYIYMCTYTIYMYIYTYIYICTHMYTYTLHIKFNFSKVILNIAKFYNKSNVV